MDTLLIKKLTADAITPKRATKDSVGYDLACIEDIIVGTGYVTKVRTGISMKIPVGYYGRIAPRSGLSAVHGIVVLAGVIDPDYTGEVVVLLTSVCSQKIEIPKGRMVAQLILEACATFPVSEVDNLDQTDRGENGFGSTDSKRIILDPKDLNV